MAYTYPVSLRGSPGSPYTRKMLSLLRYRRIAYRYMIRSHGPVEGYPSPKVELLPTFYLPGADGELEAVVDSTPIIRRFEREVSGRGVLPPDPVLRFVDEVLEDFGDEWLTKAMFHYRWAFEADVAQAAAILPRWMNVTWADDFIARQGAFFSKRQIDRLYVVGSNATTGKIIEANYMAFLDAFDAHLQAHPFLMGGRPGASDFAVFGQLTQLAHFDPTPTQLTLTRSPRTYAWVDVMEDLSGLEARDEDWLTGGTLPETLKALLALVGRVYLPLLVANAAALDAGRKTIDAEIDGAPWVQDTNPYQAKCLLTLRRSFGDLAGADRAAAAALLEETGCAALMQAG
ncbi:MAG: glutathione S-transferase [Parvibaculum sp.]|uniref:glutathione S-transferase family protein n=1 Tax=Parvibaculum sp. TaxID=2024848 RepID=UPI0025D3D3F1|nr:glutathione S-transferase family protein [Parvibaculum sp.]MCE9648161.1 glutathione S-transferase [Parvibaculum sp.]